MRTMFEFRERKEDERPRFVVEATSYQEAVDTVHRLTSLQEGVLILMHYSLYQMPFPVSAVEGECK